MDICRNDVYTLRTARYGPRTFWEGLGWIRKFTCAPFSTPCTSSLVPGNFAVFLHEKTSESMRELRRRKAVRKQQGRQGNSICLASSSKPSLPSRPQSLVLQVQLSSSLEQALVRTLFNKVAELLPNPNHTRQFRRSSSSIIARNDHRGWRRPQISGVPGGAVLLKHFPHSVRRNSRRGRERLQESFHRSRTRRAA